MHWTLQTLKAASSMKNVWQQVTQFNSEILGIDRQEVNMIPGDEAGDLWEFITEELGEFLEAETVAEEVDALLDIIYFAVGGLAKAGLSPRQMHYCMTAVHEANMTKSLGRKDSRPDIQGTDAKKPDDFVDPNETIAEILGV